MANRINTQPAPTPATKPGRRPRQPESDRHRQFRYGMAAVLGASFPLLSLLLSGMAGEQADAGSPLAVLGSIVCIALLCVSLYDVRDALRKLTGVRGWRGWAVAITLDVAVIYAELSKVMVPSQWWQATFLMLVVGGFSSVLNAYSFITHKR